MKRARSGWWRFEHVPNGAAASTQILTADGDCVFLVLVLCAHKTCHLAVCLLVPVWLLDLSQSADWDKKKC